MNAALLEWNRNSGRIYFQCIYYSSLILSERMKKCNIFETSLMNLREKKAWTTSVEYQLRIQTRSRDAELELAGTLLNLEDLEMI